MSYDSLKKIINDLDLVSAFKRVKYDSGYDFIQIPIENEIFESKLTNNIEFIVSSIKSETYTIKRLRKMWVPKKNFFLRPGSIPQLEDRIIFQALVDKIAYQLEAQLPPITNNIVFSSRLHPDKNSEKVFIHPKELWLSFKKKTIDLCRSSEYKFVLVSDIASYFENIDLRLMQDTLKSIGVDPDYVISINYFLSVWANGRTKGLPQMLAPSSLLANIYLSQVDKNLLMKGYEYIRYVDDIRIFVKNESDLRKALLDLTEQLKLTYLDVQASKTKLIRTSVLEKEMLLLEEHLQESGIKIDEDSEEEYHLEMNEQSENPNKLDVSKSEEDDKGDNDIPEERLVLFLSKILKKSNYDDRHLRFCLNNLARINSSAGVDAAIDNLKLLPQETANFVNYLSKINSNSITRDHIEKILTFLESDYCIYDWQIMWILILLIRIPLLENKDLTRLYRMNGIIKHDINKALLYYLLLIKGDLTIKRDIMSKYSSELPKEVRMAILSGIFELDERERNRFYAIATQERCINQLIEILKNRKCSFI